MGPLLGDLHKRWTLGSPKGAGLWESIMVHQSTWGQPHSAGQCKGDWLANLACWFKMGEGVNLQPSQGGFPVEDSMFLRKLSEQCSEKGQEYQGKPWCFQPGLPTMGHSFILGSLP